MRKLDNLGYVLEKVLTGLEMGTRTREYLALTLWPDIVGEHIARITAVQSVQKGVLKVDVESSAWAQELDLCRPELIAKINRHVGPDAIQDIVFRTRVSIKRPAAKPERKPRRRRGEPSEIQLTLDECREIEETALKVHEPELRQALTSTMASYTRMDRWMVQEGWIRCKKCRALHRRKRGCPFCTLDKSF